MYYSIVYKNTGIMLDNIPNIRDNMERPLHEDLTYVEANDFLYKLLVSVDPADHTADKPVDWSKTHYDFNLNNWVIVHLPDPLAVDPVEEQLKQRDSLIAIANRKLSVPDLPAHVKEALENYIEELQQIEVNAETSPTIFWPSTPV